MNSKTKSTMFCEKASSYVCYSGDCGLCNGCCGGPKNISHGYKFPMYMVDAENDATKEEKYKNKVKKQFQDIKNTTVKYTSPKDIVNIINDYEDVDAYYKRFQDVTENILGDYEEGDELPAKYLHIASRVNPTIGGNYLCEESDGYLFCMDHFKRMYELDTEQFDDYVRQFPEFQEKIKKVMDDHGWVSRENPGTLPLETMYEGKKYTLIQHDCMGILCDEKDCSMISHCTIETDPSGMVSEYYSTLPYYTHNKKHELCALCAIK